MHSHPSDPPEKNNWMPLIEILENKYPFQSDLLMKCKNITKMGPSMWMLANGDQLYR